MVVVAVVVVVGMTAYLAIRFARFAVLCGRLTPRSFVSTRGPAAAAAAAVVAVVEVVAGLIHERTCMTLCACVCARERRAVVAEKELSSIDCCCPGVGLVRPM